MNTPITKITPCIAASLSSAEIFGETELVVRKLYDVCLAVNKAFCEINELKPQVNPRDVPWTRAMQNLLLNFNDILFEHIHKQEEEILGVKGCDDDCDCSLVV